MSLERKDLKKIVYEDDNNTKVIKGYIISQDEFVYEIEALNTKEPITIGKRAIIKISPLGVNNNAYWLWRINWTRR